MHNQYFYVQLKPDYEEKIRSLQPDLFRFAPLCRDKLSKDDIYPVLAVDPTKVTLRIGNHIEQTETTLLLIPDKNDDLIWLPIDFFKFIKTASS
jgi:hypothetical protein